MLGRLLFTGYHYFQGVGGGGLEPASGDDFLRNQRDLDPGIPMFCVDLSSFTEAVCLPKAGAVCLPNLFVYLRRLAYPSCSFTKLGKRTAITAVRLPNCLPNCLP